MSAENNPVAITNKYKTWTENQACLHFYVQVFCFQHIVLSG